MKHPRTDDDVFFFISSGVNYNILKKETYFKKDKNNYTIINSRVLAPSHYSFLSESQIQDAETEDVFLKILNEIGHIDIIHFNNLEGIPVKLLTRIKKERSDIKIVYSFHNYYPFCPQVNLWERESNNCKDYNDGKKCINCTNHSAGEDIFKKTYFANSILMSFGVNEGGFRHKKIMSLAHRINNAIWGIKRTTRKKNENNIVNMSFKSNYFSNRRSIFIDEINKNCDSVLTVSKRVMDICEKFGIDKNLMQVSYIGTAHEKYFELSSPKENDIRTICFMGYMRKDKGFEFFLDSIESMDNNYARKINIVIAAKNTNEYLHYRIKELTKKFNKVIYSDGYNHTNIDQILKDVDLGIIPVLWEDNLPQVAIEMHCRKIPLLTSNLGGASELHGKNDAFTFSSGNQKDFLTKIYALVDQGYDRETYWNKALEPQSVEEHILNLLDIYKAM
ncbi:glycosyltransferase [Escherichia coli]|nr:glycosyltransferase [Escherichia coli]